jgi:hypothetical protein
MATQSAAVTPTYAERVLSLRDRVLGNDPDYRNPEAYHLEKSQIARELEELAMERR